jgi:hypothetical protein
MDTKILEEYQHQYTEWQKKFFDIWFKTLPTNGMSTLNFSENFNKSLKFQEEFVSTYLESQEKTFQMMMNTQRQFWNNYFDMMRKTTVASDN